MGDGEYLRGTRGGRIGGGMRLMRRLTRGLWLFVAMTCIAILMQDCATVRHVAVIADASFAQAIFAVSNAEYEGCSMHTPPFTVDVCAQADPPIKAALLDLDAVTTALQAMPKNGSLPKNLPALVKDLTTLQSIAGTFNASPAKNNFIRQIEHAVNQAIGLLDKFTGAN